MVGLRCEGMIFAKQLQYIIFFIFFSSEILGALISVIIIWVLVGILVLEASKRAYTMDFEVDVDKMLIISCIGVFINVMYENDIFLIFS